MRERTLLLRAPVPSPLFICPYHFRSTRHLVLCPEDGATSFLRNVSKNLPQNITFQKTVNCKVVTLIWAGLVICCWPSPAQPFFVSGPAGPMLTCHHPEYLRSNVCSIAPPHVSPCNFRNILYNTHMCSRLCKWRNT